MPNEIMGDCNNCNTYDLNGIPVRTTVLNGQRVYALVDLAAAFGLARSSVHRRADQLPEAEQGVAVFASAGGRQRTRVVTAAGLSRIVSRLRLSMESARRLQNWFAEVNGEVMSTGQYVAPGLPAEQPNPSTAIAPAAQPSSNDIDSMITLAQQQVQSLQLAREQQRTLDLHDEQIRILNENSETLAGAIREVESRAQQVVAGAIEQANRLRADFSEWADRDENIPYPECTTRTTALVKRHAALLGDHEFRKAWEGVYELFRVETGRDLKKMALDYNRRNKVRTTVVRVAEVKGYARELLRSVRHTLGRQLENYDREMAALRDSYRLDDEIYELIEEDTWH